MQRYPIIYLRRRYNSHCLRCFLSIFIFILLTIYIFIYRHSKPIASGANAKLVNLLNTQKILVPVNINRLYDYRVVCSTNNGIVNQNDYINQLKNICQVNFHGNISVNLNPPDDFQIRSLSTLKSWQNSTIKSCPLYENETIAILISYRDREKNLKSLLYNLIPYLQRQMIVNYKIFIIEQQTTGAFNKGRLYNIGFNYIMKTYKPTCVIFHDVDLIPENDQNLYSCLELNEHPFHMSANVRSRMDGTYTTIYSFLVGGVLAIRPKTFRLLNGYSNQYFNWGGEDDDLGLRFLSKDICVQRPLYGYYYAGIHSVQTRNKNRFKLLFDAVLRQDIDGLNNIEQLAVIKNIYEYSLVNWLTVEWNDKELIS